MTPFEKALSEAEKQLEKKTAQRDKARADLTKLDYEIPGLMNTINVLRQQLGKEPIPVSATAVGLNQNISPQNVSQVPIEIPHNFNAHEVGPGMGAIPATPTQPDGDFDVMELPGMNEGGWV